MKKISIWILALIALNAPARAADGVSGGRAWMPPFAPVSAGFAARAQNLMAPGLNPDSEFDRRVLGAMAAQLPKDFEARLVLTGSPEQKAEIMGLLDAAKEKAFPQVQAAVRERSFMIAADIVSGRLKGAEVTAAAKELRGFALYGVQVRSQLAAISRVARQGAKTGLTLSLARAIGAELLDRKEDVAFVKVADSGTGAGAPIRVNLAKPEAPRSKPSPIVEQIILSAKERARNAIRNLKLFAKAREAGVLLADIKSEAKKKKIGYVAHALKTLRHPDEIKAFQFHLQDQFTSQEAIAVILAAIKAEKIQDGTEAYWLAEPSWRE